ncbi:hypothetical protein [Vibrio coralliilyticus]|uniref:hypothetical protein n=1 Tax=Vibrio coralliilyticus TaxID=190893 RepID=UPI000C169FE8|nr:hypothetical protein [Vibrio coralliilyticus]
MNLNLQAQPREHSVFLEKFEDGSVYFAAKKQWPENAAKSLSWAKLQKRQRPLVAKYLKFDGQSSRQQLATKLSKKEAELMKSSLIRNSVLMGDNNLNIIKETDVDLSDGRVSAIQRYCKCGYNRAVELVELFNAIK